MWYCSRYQRCRGTLQTLGRGFAGGVGAVCLTIGTGGSGLPLFQILSHERSLTSGAILVIRQLYGRRLEGRLLQFGRALFLDAEVLAEFG